jgi:hypothetical protein
MSTMAGRPRRASDTPGVLDDFIDVVEHLHRDHRVSFVQAGDEKIFAYGGGGYVLVISELVFGGLVELQTPTASLRVEPDASGALTVVVVTPEGGSAASILEDGCAGLRRYYGKRYWTV